MKTAELIGPALDWAVDKAEGGSAPTNPDALRSYLLQLDEDERWNTLCKYTPGDINADMMSDADMIEYGLITWRCPPVSTDWAQGGPIIERESINLNYTTMIQNAWVATSMNDTQEFGEYGPTPLIAAMRCYVASKLGDTIDIPEELA